MKNGVKKWRKELIECKMEERNECEQMDEMNRWTDGTETDVSRWTDRTDGEMGTVGQME